MDAPQGRSCILLVWLRNDNDYVITSLYEYEDIDTDLSPKR